MLFRRHLPGVPAGPDEAATDGGAELQAGPGQVADPHGPEPQHAPQDVRPGAGHRATLQTHNRHPGIT